MTFLLLIWNRYTWQPKLILGLLLLVLILGGFLYCSQKPSEIEQLKEQRATEIRTEINAIDNKISNVKQNQENANVAYNISVNKDSNKYSSNQTQTTNNFCSSMCKRHILDSTCLKWAEDNQTKCD